jgi:hypothetical protein
MKSENLAVVAVFIAFIGAVIYGGTGESFPVPLPKTVTVTVPFSVP